jgi:hypothetical protein
MKNRLLFEEDEMIFVSGSAINEHAAASADYII